MPDCVSLPNAAELCDVLRKDAAISNKYTESRFLQAADAIEALVQENVFLSQTMRGLIEIRKDLIAENAKLKTERDAAVNDLTFSYKHQLSCFTCKHDFGESAAERCMDCEKYSGWEWRGVQDD